MTGRRVYLPYWQWEDWADGLYAVPRNLASEIVDARALLSCPGDLYDAMSVTVDAWPCAAEHQLTNLQQNRRAWLGQAACRFKARATAVATRAAWPQLDDAERAAANTAAERVIREWEVDHAEALFGR